MDARLLEKERYDHTPAVEAASVATELDRAAEVFAGVRPRLIEIAYRILGTVSETEDVVQEAWFRWQRTDRSVVRNADAILTTTTTRLALNVAQSARSRREAYTEPWLLEQADPRLGPEARAERGDAVERAVLLLLQRLTPTERATYILREAFSYPYQQIAEVLLVSSAHARQLALRAHKRIASGRRRLVSAIVHRRFMLASGRQRAPATSPNSSGSSPRMWPTDGENLTTHPGSARRSTGPRFDQAAARTVAEVAALLGPVGRQDRTVRPCVTDEDAAKKRHMFACCSVVLVRGPWPERAEEPS
jgi:RNA polymerase sigma factor (sigma-70 family)